MKNWQLFFFALVIFLAPTTCLNRMSMPTIMTVKHNIPNCMKEVTWLKLCLSTNGHRSPALWRLSFILPSVFVQAAVIAWILPRWVWSSLWYVPWNPQSTKTFSYCHDYMFWGVIDSESIESFGWRLGLDKDCSIVAYHRGLEWCEHTLGVTYRVCITGRCGALKNAESKIPATLRWKKMATHL